MNLLDPDRQNMVKARVKVALERRTTGRVHAWPRADKELPQVELACDWVKFSTLNHRTRAEQDRVKRETGRDDIFIADPLGDEAQEAQYEILCNQVGFDLLKEDLTVRQQVDPAIITADGILINGNRRTAALRSLWKSGDLNARYVTCLVLPEDASPEELVDLEAELQVANSFKQDYSWINEALLIEELYERSGKSWENVAARMHRTEPDVRGKYEKLQLVHQLVGLSAGSRLHLDFVDNESVFDELAKHIRNKPQQEADAVRAVYFLGALTETPYRKLRDLKRPKAASMVRNEILDDPSLKPVMDAAEVFVTADSDDPLSDVLGESSPPSPLHNLLRFVATKRPESSVVVGDGQKVQVQDVLHSIGSSISAAADEAKESDRDQSALSAPLTRADRAINELQRALEVLPRARAFDGWDEVALAERVAALESLIKKISVIR